MVTVQMKEESKFITMEHGELFVMISGVLLMPELFANNWAMKLMVLLLIIVLNLAKEQAVSFWTTSSAVEVNQIYLTVLTMERVFTIVVTVKMLEFSVLFQVAILLATYFKLRSYVCQS